MSIKLRWLGIACFEIALPSGKVIVTDPCIDISLSAPITVGDVTGADYITITHGSPTTTSDVGPLARRFNSKVICNPQTAEPLAKFFDIDRGNMLEANVGDAFKFEDLTVHMLKAKHISLLESAKVDYLLHTGREPSSDMTMKDMQATVQVQWAKPGTQDFYTSLGAAVDSAHWINNLNFLFETSDNLRILFWDGGPYKFLSHVAIDAHPHILIMQLGGSDPEEVADFAALCGAQVIIPSHHDVHGGKKERELSAMMASLLAAKSSAKFLNVVRGRWYTLGMNMLRV